MKFEAFNKLEPLFRNSVPQIEYSQSSKYFETISKRYRKVVRRILEKLRQQTEESTFYGRCRYFVKLSGRRIEQRILILEFT